MATLLPDLAAICAELFSVMDVKTAVWSFGHKSVLVNVSQQGDTHLLFFNVASIEHNEYCAAAQG